MSRIRTERFSSTPVDTLLTYSENIAMHTEEPIVFHDYYEKFNFKHWVENIYSSEIIYRDKAPTYTCGDDFFRLRDTIQDAV